MPKYIKQEMTDLHGTGRTQAYYRMQIYRNMGFDEFVEHCTRHGGMQRSAVVGVLAHVSHELAMLMADGYSVTVDGLGTFSPRVGVRPDMAQDGFDAGQPSHNAHALCVSGINYRADKELVEQVDSNCRLERGASSRLRHSPYTEAERVEKARSFIRENTIMRIADYARLTGLSYTTASRELCRIAADPATGITARGRKSAKVYMLSDAARGHQ